jgi:hypothetical protein
LRRTGEFTHESNWVNWEIEESIKLVKGETLFIKEIPIFDFGRGERI